MLGIFKRNKLCSCMHLERWHHRYSFRDSGYCCFCMECTKFSILNDNLKYVEYVERCRKHPWKRLLAFVLDVPLSICAAIKRFQESHSNSWGEFTVSFIFVCVGLVGILGIISFALHICVIYPKEEAKKAREHQVWVETSWVKCYTGNKLLYEGRVIELEYTGASAKILSAPGKKEYLCNGFSREERVPNKG